MRKPARRLAVAGALFVMLGGRIDAQQPAPPTTPGPASRRFIGVVLDSAGTAVPFAELRLTAADGRRVAGTTDEAGRFSLPDIPAGPARLEVRRLGYRPYVELVTVPATGGAAEGTRILLAATAAQLAGIEVSDSSSERDPALAGFYARRRNNNFGHYLDRGQIEATHAQRASEALRAVPGVLIQPSRRVGNVVRVRGCRPTVWLDGVRIADAELDEVTTVDDVAAVEIYKSLAGLPQQFVDRTNPCGAILIWSRSH